ncbi:MAG: hypothetical protein A3C58_02515 [Candidatus Staskawiczbacteria bacterium RIFCSPHIGHO2_02_FULL_34_10]|uniref:Uncharacterized protein n=2 Tax=Candidatus Staskawicziibacteriota TaxID=1817916 RepID=A0A1G2HN72_9BACT|nr:MAG: hypothetical protein A2639_00200 [Candidatus Staskawiczbacteria bacterium RIFCSPHIGHO2_01_FULL_34_27]OGZ66556.1 MAG: hypothetical protein A3C58_02515 [Candidatus Staskawiczbacteria bacterium RIFCSPHIGHO2_02_FULL_34_10]
MSYFFWGFLTLFVSTVVFYIVFFVLSYYWHERRMSFIIVPLIYTFEFFIAGFLIVCLLLLLINYLPDILKLV